MVANATKLAAVAVLTGALITAGGCSLFTGSAPTAAVGACLQSSAVNSREVEELPTVDCGQPHDVEVVETFDLAGDTYPGEQAITTEAETKCTAAAESYYGGALGEDLSVSYVYPLEAHFPSDREVICFITTTQDVTGSIKGTA